jgi:hypothetical protein
MRTFMSLRVCSSLGAQLISLCLLTYAAPLLAQSVTASTACVGLGLRQFAVSKPPSAFLASPVGGADISGQGWLTDSLDICAGPPAGDDRYPLILTRDVVLGIPTIVPGLQACVKFFAADSHGALDCDGGDPSDIVITQNSHGAGMEDAPIIASSQGQAGRPGEATLFVDMSLKLLSGAASIEVCKDADFSKRVPVALTTAAGRLVINEPLDLFGGQTQLTISGRGENFSCATWTQPSSPGVLIVPTATLDMPFVGDAAAILKLGSEPIDNGPLCDAVVEEGALLQAGNAEDEKTRYQILSDYQASLSTADPLYTDLQKLLPVIDRWANGRDDFWVPGEQALNASGYLANFFDLQATPGSNYPPKVARDSQLCPMWAMYRGRMLIQQVIQTAFILNDNNLRKAYMGEGREALSIAAAAFPDNRILRMWLDEPIPWQAYSADPRAPQWANSQREALEKLADIIDFWIDERQTPDGQFGGGWSDDVEMWRLWTPILVGFHDDKLEAAQRLLSEGIFELPRLVGGYTSILSDVEHSSEDTGDTITAMLHIDPADPAWAARAYTLATLMRDVWSGQNDKGFLQFRSGYFTFSENSPDPDFACDTPYHSRTLQPALLLWQRTRDAALTGLFTEWLDTWVDATASTERGKPAGVVPAAIHWPSGQPAGPEPDWWNPGCAISTDRGLYTWPSQISPKLQSLLLAWWITKDEKYLAPIRSMAQVRRTYLAAPNNNAAAGSAQWVGRRLGTNLTESLSKYRMLSGDSSNDDLLARDSSAYMKYRLSGNLGDLMPALNNTVNAFRINRESYTTEVRWTDRLFRYASNYANYYATPTLPTPSVDILYSMLTGDPGDPLYLPLNAVRWQTNPREFAALVRSSSATELTASLYHFGNQPRLMGAQFPILENGLYEWVVDCGTSVKSKGGFLVDAVPPGIEFSVPSRRECVLTVSPITPVGC